MSTDDSSLNQSTTTTASPWYFIGNEDYPPANPSGATNLTDLYGLRELANSVARFDPQTQQKRKLRKSYKNEIADLPGKHNIPSSSAGTGYSLIDLARKPPSWDPSTGGPPPPLRPQLDEKKLNAALNFDKTPATGLPDFDVSLIGSASLVSGQSMQRSNSNKRLSGVAAAGTGGESSDDTAKKLKKKKRKDNGAFEEGGDIKRRKF